MMRSGLHRRVGTALCAALLTAGVVVPGSGCRSSATPAANGLTPVRLQLDWYPQPEHGGFFEAQLNGYYKAELIYGPARTGPWKTVEDVELATLGWVYWHNTSRLHSYLNDIPPTEFEAAFYDAPRTDQTLVEIQ